MINTAKTEVFRDSRWKVIEATFKTKDTYKNTL